MEDKNLKNLLNKDMSTPKRPVDEWASISRKIKPKGFFLKLVIPTMVAASISFMVILNTANQKTVIDLEVANYLLEEKLFVEGDDQLYAWVE